MKSFSPGIPFTVALAGIACFAGMDVMMKGLAIELGVYNAMLWRCSIALVAATIAYICSKPTRPDRITIRLHLIRGLIISLMAYLFFWGLVFVPLAEAIALSFIAPLIALYLAAVILKEKIGRWAILASIIGLAGTIVVVSGKTSGHYSSDVGKGVAAIMTSAMLYAYNLILQRQQAVRAGAIEIAFFQNATVVGIYLLFAPFLAVIPDSSSLPALSGAGILGFVSALMIAWAYARAEAKILIPVEYTAFIWAAIFGWLVFAETLTVSTLAGTALIVLGCLIAARQEPSRIDHVESTTL